MPKFKKLGKERIRYNDYVYVRFIRNGIPIAEVHRRKGDIKFYNAVQNALVAAKEISHYSPEIGDVALLGKVPFFGEIETGVPKYKAVCTFIQWGDSGWTPINPKEMTDVDFNSKAGDCFIVLDDFTIGYKMARMRDYKERVTFYRNGIPLPPDEQERELEAYKKVRLSKEAKKEKRRMYQRDWERSHKIQRKNRIKKRRY